MIKEYKSLSFLYLTESSLQRGKRLSHVCDNLSSSLLSGSQTSPVASAKFQRLYSSLGGFSRSCRPKNRGKAQNLRSRCFCVFLQFVLDCFLGAPGEQAVRHREAIWPGLLGGPGEIPHILDLRFKIGSFTLAIWLFLVKLQT